MGRYHPNQTSSHQFSYSLPCKRSINPQTIRENGRGDELVLWGLRQKLIIGGLIKQHHVVHLLLLLSLAPLLLLLFAAAGLGGLGRRRRSLVLLRCHRNGSERGGERREERVATEADEEEGEMATHYYHDPQASISVSQVLGIADSISLSSEPPDVRNWFSSYAYESPKLSPGDGFEGCAFKGSDCVEEGFDEEEEKNLGEFRKVRNKDELVVGEVASTVEHHQNHKNKHASQVLDSSDSLALSSDPPNITKWFPSYVYESPVLDSVNDFRGSDFIESECDRVVGNAENCSKEKEEILTELRITTKRHALAADAKKSSNDLVKCNSSVRDDKYDHQYRSKDIHGVAGNKISAFLNDLPVQMISGRVLKGKPAEKKQYICPTQNVEKSSLDSKDFTGNKGDNREVDITSLNGNVSSIRKQICGSTGKENDGMTCAENCFVSTRNNRNARTNYNSSSKRSMEVHSDCLRNRGMFPSVVDKEAILRRKPLLETTNFHHADASEITGKWLCPQKSKPNLGPPLKQLRLEQWVNRL